MKSYFLGFKITLILILVAMIPACMSVPSDNQSQKDNAASFEVTMLEVSPKWLFVGDNATVTAQVTNWSKINGQYKAVFQIDGQPYSEKEVRIPRGQNVNISCVVSSTIPATKVVAIGNQKVTINFYTGKQTEIQYDSYDLQMPPGSISALAKKPSREPYGQMVCFTAPVEPFKVKRIQMGIMGVSPDNDKNPQMTINIWDNKGNKLWSQNHPWPVVVGKPVWQDYSVPNISVSEDFYIEMVSCSSSALNDSISSLQRYLCLAATESNIPTRSSFSNNGMILRHASSIGDTHYLSYCVRVIGDGGPVTLLSYDDGGAEMYYAPSNYSYSVTYSSALYPFELNSIQFYAYRGIEMFGDQKMTIKVIDKITKDTIWQKNISWSVIPYSTANKGTWVNIDTGSVICNNDFYVEIIPNNGSDRAIWLGCDSGAKNNNSSLSINGDIIHLGEWTRGTYRIVDNTPSSRTNIYNIVNGIVLDFGQQLNPTTEWALSNIGSYTEANTKWMIRAIGIPK